MSEIDASASSASTLSTVGTDQTQGVPRFTLGMIDLVDGEHEQGDLFNPTPNNEKLMQVFDGLNHRFGTDTVFLGAQGIQQKWKMRRDKLTPQYTTKWQDLPRIKC